jgi:hypothetical protein
LPGQQLQSLWNGEQREYGHEHGGKAFKPCLIVGVEARQPTRVVRQRPELALQRDSGRLVGTACLLDQALDHVGLG